VEEEQVVGGKQGAVDAVAARDADLHQMIRGGLITEVLESKSVGLRCGLEVGFKRRR
jgi:hypothetical protein